MKFLAFILVVFLLVVLPCVVFAAPFLTCDPHPDATKFEIEINGQVIPADAIGTVGSLSIYHDLGSLPEGPYVFRARAGNSWGLWSDWAAPLDEVKASPGPVSGFGISER